MFKLRAAIGGTAAAVAVAVVFSMTASPASAAAAGGSAPASAAAAVAAAETAGFVGISANRLVETAPATVVALGPALAVVIPSAEGGAVGRDGVTVNGPAADGSVTVVKPGGFGVFTNRHGDLEYRYKVIMPAGTTLVEGPDGGLNQVTPSGRTVGRVDPATAVDSAGRQLPASYGYDAAARELVVKADATAAAGGVFVDPSWRCWAVASAYGAVFVVAAFAWIFTDGSVVWVMWALRAWFGLSFGAADAIARACTLH